MQMPTVTSHEIRIVSMLAMLQQMADAAERFLGLSADFRGCAIFRGSGLIAATGDGDKWIEAGRSLLEAADRAAGGRVTHAHVATEEGEAFAIRSSGLEMVAVADRFTLASLAFADMRAALRDAVSAVEAPRAEAA